MHAQQGRRMGRAVAKAGWGQAAVEMALALVIFVPVIVGAVDLGRAYFAYDVLVHAVNEGVRVGTFDARTTNIVSAVHDAGTSINLASEDVTVTCYSGSGTTATTCASMVLGDSVQVQATVLFTPITPLISSLLPGGTLTIAATARRSFQ